MGGREHGAQGRIGEKIIEPPDDLLAGAFVGFGIEAGIAVLKKLPRVRVDLIERRQALDHDLLKIIERRIWYGFDDGRDDIAKQRGLQSGEFCIEQSGHDVFDEADGLGNIGVA